MVATLTATNLDEDHCPRCGEALVRPRNEEVARLRAALAEIVNHMNDNGMQSWRVTRMAAKALEK